MVYGIISNWIPWWRIISRRRAARRRRLRRVRYVWPFYSNRSSVTKFHTTRRSTCRVFLSKVANRGSYGVYETIRVYKRWLKIVRCGCHIIKATKEESKAGLLSYGKVLTVCKGYTYMDVGSWKDRVYKEGYGRLIRVKGCRKIWILRFRL